MMSDTVASQSDVNPFELAIPVSDRVQMQSILIMESHSRRAEDERIALGGFSLKNEFSNLGVEIRDNCISVRISFALRSIRDGETEADPVLVIGALFVLIYSIPSTEGIEDRNLAAFAATNGVYNAWPYWREYVQSTSVRMGLPPIAVPVFRLPAGPSATPSASEPEAPMPSSDE